MSCAFSLRAIPLRILAAYPYLEPADIDACLLYASVRVEDEELAPVPA